MKPISRHCDGGPPVTMWTGLAKQQVNKAKRRQVALPPRVKKRRRCL